MPNMNYPRKLLRAATYNSLIPITTCRKRILSEQNEFHQERMKLSNDDLHINKKTKTESFINESNNINQHHVLSFPPYSSFKNNATQYLDLSHLNSAPCSQSTTTNNENEQQQEENHSSIFLTSFQLIAYITSTINNILIIDCGSPLRHNERRIKESFLLNINDKLSRKRLINRGLKNFLEQTQFNRLNQSEIIILYDDSIQTISCSNQYKLSPCIQCIYDQIKRHDSNKIIYILSSSFEEFYQHYPIFCYVSSTNNHLLQENPLPSPTLDLDLYEMSEILPGLYLGNANDAKNLGLLKQNKIKSIINISTTIPCYYENENLFDYIKLHCNDSIQENILQYFDSTFEYIQKKLSNNENVLVHCQGGISRSPSFIIGYLMKYHLKTFDQAYLLVKEKRKIINLNLNFHTQLTRYEQMIQ